MQIELTLYPHEQYRLSSRDPSPALASGGALSLQLPNFQPRECQQELAQAVALAIETRSSLVAEAGTGTGKTFAYLLPALQAGARTVVSTGTKALQDQLFHRDLPLLMKALNVEPKVALLKGRANYLCRYRLENYQSDGLFVQPEEVSQLRQIRTWASRTQAGDRAELSAISEDAPIWAQVTSTTDNCLGGDCPSYGECHVVHARRKAQEADVVVVNHHLLFADMALKQEGFGELLPGAELIVLDEAHQIVDTATQFFGTSISGRQLIDLARDSLREGSQVSGLLSLIQTPAQQLEHQVRVLRAALDQVPQRGNWRDLADSDEIIEAIADLGRGLATLSAVLNEHEEVNAGIESCAARGEALSTRLVEVTRDGSAIEAEQVEPRVRWYECRGRGFGLHSTPLDIAEPLRKYREQSGSAWVLTSATLAVGERFDHYLNATGLEKAKTLLLDSPFDYRNQAVLLVPPGLPEPNQPTHTAAVLQVALPLIEAAKGGCFLLFTSHRALKEAAERLRGAISYPLFVQGEAPRHQLLEDFRACGNGVLLGAASFWEGVDVRGDALKLVIIDRLPFAQPDDPVARARADGVSRRGLSPFRELSLPEAVLSLKQGAGRLIRDVDDRGVLVICDPRIRTKSYGRIFLNSLPPMRRTQNVDAAARFLREMRDPPATLDAAGESSEPSIEGTAT